MSMWLFKANFVAHNFQPNVQVRQLRVSNGWRKAHGVDQSISHLNNTTNTGTRARCQLCIYP